MKTRGIIYSLSVALISLSLILVSCKKKEKEPEETGQSSTDSRDVQGENDAAVNDVNDVIANQVTKLRGKAAGESGGQGVTGTICGLTVDTVNINTGVVKLNYTGITCNNRTRTGSIRLTMLDYNQGKRWKNKGAVIKAEYLGYKVTRASDGKSIQLDGEQLLTNESGGSWWELLIVKTQPSLVSTIIGTNLKVTFSDGKTAIYNINRKVTYTFPNGIITCMAEGIGASGGLSNLENYGTTRDGDTFTSQVNTPIVWNLTCGPGAPIQGEVNIKVSSKSFDLKATFGVDANGNVITVGANQCAFGWRLDWTYKNEARNKIFGYN